MKTSLALAFAAAVSAGSLEATFPVVGDYDEREVQHNAVNHQMNYSSSNEWTTGVGQELGASQIIPLARFKERVAAAFAAGRGGVVNFDNGSLDDNQSFTATFAGGNKSLTFSNTPGNGGSYHISPVANRTAVSGNDFLSRDGTPHFDLTLGNYEEFGPKERVVAIGLTILGRNGVGWFSHWRVIAYYTNGVDEGSSSTFFPVDTGGGNAQSDSFAGIAAPEGYWITRIRAHSDHGHYTSIDDLAFITDTVTPASEHRAPFTLDFGRARSQAGAYSLLRSHPTQWNLRNDGLAVTSERQAFLSTTAVAEVANHQPEQDFFVSAEMRVLRAPTVSGQRIGLVVAGLEDAYADDESFYGLFWSPTGGEGGASELEIRHGFGGDVLAQTPWPGDEPIEGATAIVFQDDFEGHATGWTGGGAQDLWEIGYPVSGPPDSPGGGRVAGTGLNEKYGFNTDVWFRSPVIDLRGATTADLRYWEFSDVDPSGNAEYHYTQVSVLAADSREPIAELGRYNDQTEGWRGRIFDLPAEALGREVVLEFRLVSDELEGLGHDGWFLNEVEVRARKAPVYRMEAEATHHPDGSLNLRFVLSDESGISESVSAHIPSPLGGPLFGFGGRLRTEEAANPEFEFVRFHLDVPPFSRAFGNRPGRDSGSGFTRNLPEQWSITEDALRLSADGDDYRTSLAVRSVRHAEEEKHRFVELRMTLASLGSESSENRAGLVLYGSEAGLDPEDDTTYHTFQWAPHAAEGPYIALRRGMDGGIVSRTFLAETDRPPSAEEGGRYTFRFLTLPVPDGSLRFRGILTDEHGGEATVSGILPVAPAGAGFGFGARHRAAEQSVWDFHELNWSRSAPAPLPVNLAFGTEAGRHEPIRWRMSNTAGEEWLLREEFLRLFRSESRTESGFPASIAGVSSLYTPGRDFTVRTSVTPRLVVGPEPALYFDVDSDPDSRAEVGTTGADPERGTVALWFNLRSTRTFDGRLFGHLAPRDTFSNRIYISYRAPDGLSVSLGNSNILQAHLLHPRAGDWHHVALTWESGAYRAYVDGEEVASGAYFGLNEISDVFAIGNIGHQDRTEFSPDALIKEVSVWNEALSDSDIQALRSNGLSGDESGLVGYWPLDEGSGVIALDHSPNHNHGTLSGARWIRPKPRLGIAFLGRDDDPVATSYSFEWLPHETGGAGELRLTGPASAGHKDILGNRGLADATDAPVFENDATYQFELRGTHRSDGTLELTGTLADEAGREAAITIEIPEAHTAPRGSWFGVTGRQAILDWHDFSLEATSDDSAPAESSYASWLTEYFTEAERENPLIADPLADPAGDRVPNLLKYAFGLAPRIPAQAADLPVASIVDGALFLTYRERRNAGDLEYRPEKSRELIHWNAEHIEEVSRIPDGGFDQVTIRAIIPGGAPHAFLRVRVLQD